jgi:hypothetical protein
MLEDYRAGLTLDRHHGEADRAAGNRLRLLLLVLWSRGDDLEDLYGVRSPGETGRRRARPTSTNLGTILPRKHPMNLPLC